MVTPHLGESACHVLSCNNHVMHLAVKQLPCQARSVCTTGVNNRLQQSPLVTQLQNSPLTQLHRKQNLARTLPVCQLQQPVLHTVAHHQPVHSKLPWPTSSTGPAEKCRQTRHTIKDSSTATTEDQQSPNQQVSAASRCTARLDLCMCMRNLHQTRQFDNHIQRL